MKKIGDVANIVRSDGSTTQRVGDMWQGRSGGVLFQRAGSVKRFYQFRPVYTLMQIDHCGQERAAHLGLQPSDQLGELARL